MKVIKYILNVFVVFFLASAIWVKVAGLSIESQERIWGRNWMLISDSANTLFFFAMTFFMIRLMLEKRKKNENDE